MSMEDVEIWCDRCDFKSGSGRTFGRYFYELKNGQLVDLNREPGWCYRCENIESIENFSDKDFIKNEIDNNISARQKITTSISFKLFGHQKKHVMQFEEKIVQMNYRLFIHEQRKSLPKCLRCGSTDIISVKIPDPPEGAIEELPIMHLKCGGRLLAKHSDFRVNIILPKLIYTLEGDFIRKETGR